MTHHILTLLSFVKRQLQILQYCMLRARRYAEVCSRTRAEIERRGHGEGHKAGAKIPGMWRAKPTGPSRHPSPANCKGEGEGRRLPCFMFPSPWEISASPVRRHKHSLGGHCDSVYSDLMWVLREEGIMLPPQTGDKK